MPTAEHDPYKVVQVLMRLDRTADEIAADLGDEIIAVHAAVSGCESGQEWRRQPADCLKGRRFLRGCESRVWSACDNGRLGAGPCLSGIFAALDGSS